MRSERVASTQSQLRLAFTGCLALAVAMGIGRFAYTPLLPLMIGEGRLTLAEGGAIASVHFLGYWLGAVAAIWLRPQSLCTLVAALAGIGVVTIAMAMTDAIGWWLILRLLAGVLSAFVLILVGSVIVKELALTDAGHRQGWVFSGVGAGIALVGLAALGIMGVGWSSKSGWALFGVAALLAASIAAAVLARLPRRLALVNGSATQSAARLPHSLVAAYGIAGFGYVIPATYLPVMAREVVPDPLVFGCGWPVFGLAAFLSTLAAARLDKARSTRGIWSAGQLMLAAGLALPAVVPGLAAILFSGLAVGGTFMVITMAGMREAHRLCDGRDAERAVAILTSAFAAGQAVGPGLAGALHDLTGSLSAVLLLTSGAVAISAVLIFPSPKQPETARS